MVTQANSSPARPHDAPAGEQGIDLRAMYEIFHRRRWIALSVFVATLAVGGLITLRATRIYRASARVFIEERAPRVLNAVNEVYESTPASTWTMTGFYQTQQDIIRSRPVAERVVAMLDLAPEHLAAQVAAADGNVTGGVVDGLPEDIKSKLAILGFDRVRFASRADLIEALKGFDVITAMQNRVQLAPMRDSRIATISIDDPSRERAAMLANAVADAYVEYSQDQRFTTNHAAVQWLTRQVDDLRDKLQKSELSLHQFRQDNNIVSVSIEDRQSMVAQTLVKMNDALADTTAERIQLEARLGQVKAALSAGMTLDGIEMIANQPLVQALKGKLIEVKQEWSEVAARYTEEHPHAIAVHERLKTAQRELDREVTNIYKSLEEKLAAAQDNERRLRVEIESLKSEALELNRKEIDYRRLDREVSNNQDLLEVVLKREKEADLTAGLTFSNIRKFEAATAPAKPVRPLVRVNMALALVLGIILAAAAAWSADRLDNTLKTQAQVEKILSVPFLGIVPRIKVADGRRSKEPEPRIRDRFILDNTRSSVAECMRNIRTNLMFMSPEKNEQSLVVTSSGPREGKSTLAVNLAYTLALNGKRTLLIDTDMRKPRLHRSFGITNDFGISNLILGESSIEQAVQQVDLPNLSVLTCGPVPPNPAELLHTEAFHQLFDELKRRYDRIIFDSPPVSAVSDAMVLAGLVDGCILVVKAHQTTWPAGLNAKRKLASIGTRIYGVVLNDVDLDDRRASEYYQEYYHYYRHGYGDDQALEKPART